MTATKHRECHVEVHEASTEEGRAIFDKRARTLLGVSGKTFINAHRAGKYPADWRDEAIVELEMLLPFAA